MALTQMLTIKVSQEDFKSLTRKSSNEGRDNLVEGSVRLGAEKTISSNLNKKFNVNTVLVTISQVSPPDPKEAWRFP